ncbi:MAG: hypothetical protein O3B72_13515, partial [Proteobacteria bacterium]|nr:hypothetical protein [Pseudomonadota bacterium]
MESKLSYAITRCPGCSTSFRVTGEQLRLADGDVRCGACLTVFQAESYLVVPLLDATERMAIQAEYWTDFNTWLSGMGEEPSAALNKEPSAGFDEEPSAAFNKEPSAVFNEEPSPDSDTTPPAPSHVASAADEKPGSVYSDVPVFESAEPVDAVPLLTHGDPVTGEAAPVAVSVT